MQQRVLAPGDFYEPNPFAPTSKAGPPAAPSSASFLDEIGAAFRSAATVDEAPVRTREALDNALAGVVSDLERQGVDARRLRRRDPRAGFALVYDEDAIWGAVEAARRRDGKAFGGLPATLDQFREKATAPLQASIARDAEVAGQSGWTSWLTGTLGYGVTDPINTATLPLGIGATRSIGQAVLQGAKLNAGIEALALPSRAVERGAQGRELSTGEAIGSLAIAGVAGGVLGGAGKVIERAFVRSPVATEARETIGADRMTDTERGAADALDRDAEIDATNPFGGGAGAVAHANRLDAEISAILDRVAARDTPVPIATPPAVRPIAGAGGDARVTFKNKVRRAESGGDDAARNPGSSATGRYQFTRGTWLNYHKRVVGGQMSDDARWAQATDGALQERLMDALTADNARALAAIGARETPGNLYLMHFAGQGGAGKILKAAPDTPIEQVLTADAIRANGFLRGKTAGDVVEWAHAKVGGDPDVPVLPRDRYASEDQWAAAQREVDAAEAELRAADAELARAATDDGPEIVPPLERYTAIDRDAEPVGTNWEPITVDRPSFERVVDPYVAPKYMPRRTKPSDVIELLTDHGGLRDDGGHDLAKGRGLAKLTVPPLIRKTGMDVDRAGELLWESGFFVNRPTEAEVLDLIDDAARGRATGQRRYSLADQAEMDRRAELKAQNDRAAHDVREALHWHDDVYDFDGADADIFDEVLDAAFRGIEPERALADIVEARQRDALARIKTEAEEGGFDDVFPEGWVPGLDERPGGWATFVDDSLGSGNPAAGVDGPAVRGGDPRGSGPNRAADGRDGGSPAEAVAARVAPFDDPFGPGATRQADSLEHDIRMAVERPARTLYHGTRGEWLGENPNGLGMTFYALDRDAAARYAEGRGGRRIEGDSRIEERALPADARILDLTTVDGARVLASLDSSSRMASDIIASARRGVADFEKAPGLQDDPSALWPLQTNIWQATKNAAGSFAEGIRRDIADALRDQGYAGIRFTDDAHPTIALFDAPERMNTVDPAIAARQRQEADLRAASPMRPKADQDSEIGMPLFDAADQGSFRLGEDGDERGVADLLADIDGDDAAIVAARNCMVV